MCMLDEGISGKRLAKCVPTWNKNTVYTGTLLLYVPHPT